MSDGFSGYTVGCQVHDYLKVHGILGAIEAGVCFELDTLSLQPTQELDTDIGSSRGVERNNRIALAGLA